jgi:Kef-type K+ transport system membrane component KefB
VVQRDVPDVYFAHLLLVLAIVLISAKLGGHAAKRLGQPSVLGELVVGVALGNLPLLGYDVFEPWKTDPSMLVFSQLGVILLVFQVGVQSTVREMLGVGVPALLVGAFGVTGSFALGTAAATLLLPEAGAHVHIFLGATLSATSIGITARVLKDLGKARTPEARIILGAAVVDDVLGLVILAIITGAIAAGAGGAGVSAGAVLWIVFKASAFLFGALALGVALSPRLFAVAAQLDASGALIAAALGFCFLLAWVAGEMGLAPIIGAFAAGLVLEDAHSREFVERGERSLDDVLEVLTSLLVPVFFVLTGARTDLAAFTHLKVVLLALGLTAAAILGKQVCLLGTIGRPVNRLSVAIGMIPRGEVQLIFANLGATIVVAGAPLVDNDAFSAIVMVVVLTTLVTPPALARTFRRDANRGAAGALRG